MRQPLDDLLELVRPMPFVALYFGERRHLPSARRRSGHSRRSAIRRPDGGAHDLAKPPHHPGAEARALGGGGGRGGGSARSSA